MSRFTAVLSFGKKGLFIEDYKGESNVFLSHDEICIRPRISSPSELESIPEYERVDLTHYHAAQYYYFMEFSQVFEGGSNTSIVNFTEDLSLKLEREFRLGYYQRFKDDTSKVRLKN